MPLGLSDRLSLAPVDGHQDTLHVSGLDAGPPADNLVFRAIAAARAAVGGGWPGGPGPAPALAARLEKRIPVAAGLAGGSSDAAATLDGALEAWGAELDDATHHAVAARLGSDVPFFLAGGPALVEGRGETVAPLPRSPREARRPAGHAGHRRPDAGRLRRLRRHPAPGRRGCPPVVGPSRRGAACRIGRRGPRRPGGRAGVGQRPAARDRPRRAGARALQASVEPSPGPADRAVRLGTDPVGPLSFRRGRGDRRRGRSAGPRATAASHHPATPNHSSLLPRSSATRRRRNPS